MYVPCHTLSVGNQFDTLSFSDAPLQPILNESEVADVFSHPLNLFLHHQLPPTSLTLWPREVQNGSRPYHTAQDYSWRERPPHRFHTFTSRKGKAITGFTAGILINVAEIGYGRSPDYISKASEGLTGNQLIDLALSQPIWQSKGQQEFRMLKPKGGKL